MIDLAHAAGAAVELPLDSIAPDPDQPRSSVCDLELEDLARSIRAHRVIQPIVVTAHPDAGARSATPYMILVGERRWRAARLALLATIAAVVRTDEISAADRILVQLAENDDRAELHLLERALAYRRAYQLSNLSQNEFARRCDMPKSSMSRLLRVASAEGPLRKALEERLLNDLRATRHFEQLEPCAQLRLLETARRNGRPITHWRLQEARGQGETAEPEVPAQLDEPAVEKRPSRAVVSLCRAAAPAARSAPIPPTTTPAPLAVVLSPGGCITRTGASDERSIHIPFTHAMLSTNLRFLGAKPLPTLRGAAAQLCELLAAAAE
ncbi:MAG TPA: ParB/RepB/Spo0J family partition protein [Thermoanaerobaculia bacterium]|jgi:ParB family chromosome partitioning protein